MTSINRTVLAGHIGRADTNMTQSGQKVTKLSIATNRSRKDANGSWITESDWHNVVVWGIHDNLLPLIVKGAKVYVEGRLQTRSWDDQSGQKRYATEVICNSSGLMFLREAKNGPAPSAPQAPRQQQAAPQQQASQPRETIDEEIPF